MKLGWNVNQYGSDALFRQDLDRAKKIKPGAMIRLDAVNDYLALSNNQTDDTFIVPNGQNIVTKSVRSVQLPSPFVVIFRGPMLAPSIVNHSLGTDASHRPHLGWNGSLADNSDLLVIDTKMRTVKHNGVDVDLSEGSQWFDLAANDNLLTIGRIGTAGAATCSLRHTNPAVRFDWSDLDRRVNRVRDAGHFPMLMVPYWVPGEDKVQIDNISVMLQHAYFCQQLGIRYANSKVKGVQDGNEPNLETVQPGGALPSVQAKVANLINPLFPKSWKRCSMGMAPGTSADHGAAGLRMSARDYLAEFWPLAGRNYDYVGIHPYGRSTDIGEDWSVLGQMPDIYNNITHKPFWCTEYNGAGLPDSANAQYVAETLVWLNNLTGVDGKKAVAETFIFAMTDPHTESNPSYRLGCYATNGDKRPVVDSIKNWLKHPAG